MPPLIKKIKTQIKQTVWKVEIFPGAFYSRGKIWYNLFYWSLFKLWRLELQKYVFLAYKLEFDYWGKVSRKME